MNIHYSFGITISDTFIQRLQETKATAKQSLNSLTDKAWQVGDNWKQTATQETYNVIDTLNNNVEQAKDSLGDKIPQIQVKTVVSASVADFLEGHPAFLGIIKSLNWGLNHPIFSLIIVIFSLAILWSLIKAVGRLIETASLSILQIPFKVLKSLIKYIWQSLGKLKDFARKKLFNQQAINHDSKFQLNNNTPYQIISYNKQQRLKEISARLEEIQAEQQELLKEAANIIDKPDQKMTFPMSKNQSSQEDCKLI